MIELSAVTKTFKKVKVLDELSLSIGDRDRVALVGSNGAGKTTLIRCLLGEYQHEGAVRINGLDPRRQREAVLSRVGFVPQLPPPLKMPVGELVRFTSAMAEGDPERVRGIATRLGLDLDPIARRPFVRLSGGQKQKLLISIALGRDTDLLIMDEPAANLDPAARYEFFSLLAERKSGAMIISSHRLDEVASLVNRVVEMDRGRVVLDDKVEDALEMDGVLLAELAIGRPEIAFAKAMHEWGFSDLGGGIRWEGRLSGPDRLRFLGMLSRYAGLLTGVEMRLAEKGETDDAPLRERA
ncbi:MAG TPA: ABC transporter ATP-binding protein [Candidatus Sulfotelmatobacter sp.]|jgi:ABC-2 type transport system ATP-binding protein|nr:ABC transporter ATP-binding protein [Candidatus Sulfotelmatobacter sp.]